jgi:hypothetical protein
LIELCQPEETRLFNDPVVKDFVVGPIQITMQLTAMRNFIIQPTDAVVKGVYGAQVCRTRFIEDAV